MTTKRAPSGPPPHPAEIGRYDHPDLPHQTFRMRELLFRRRTSTDRGTGVLIVALTSGALSLEYGTISRRTPSKHSAFDVHGAACL